MKNDKRPVTDKQWKNYKRRAPKIPDYTCPQIDDVLERLEKIKKQQKLSQYQHDLIMKKMEKLRKDNDCLRESGIYWYEIAKKFKGGNDKYSDL
tara:strand:- start:645 stop:926 length:282 start_codon:yes stop_codon:yes gene_type:complete